MALVCARLPLLLKRIADPPIPTFPVPSPPVPSKRPSRICGSDKATHHLSQPFRRPTHGSTLKPPTNQPPYRPPPLSDQGSIHPRYEYATGREESRTCKRVVGNSLGAEWEWRHYRDSHVCRHRILCQLDRTFGIQNLGYLGLAAQDKLPKAKDRRPPRS